MSHWMTLLRKHPKKAVSTTVTWMKRLRRRFLITMMIWTARSLTLHGPLTECAGKTRTKTIRSTKETACSALCRVLVTGWIELGRISAPLREKQYSKLQKSKTPFNKRDHLQWKKTCMCLGYLLVQGQNQKAICLRLTLRSSRAVMTTIIQASHPTLQLRLCLIWTRGLVFKRTLVMATKTNK